MNWCSLFLGNTRFSRVALIWQFGSAGPCLVLLVAVLLAIPVRSASSPWSAPPWSSIPDAVLFSSNDVRSWDTLTSVGHLLFETRRINLAGAIVAPPEAKTELVSADLCENLSTTQSFRSVELLDRDLRGINFGGARILGTQFGRGTNLEGANFEKATLVKSSFEHSSLLSSSFRDACLTDVKAAFANFDSSDWIGAQVTKSHFEYARFHFSNLTKIQIMRTPMTSAELPGAVLREAKLQDVSAKDIKLQGADLTRSKLKAVDLTQAKITAAIMTHAELSDVRLDRAESRWADFSGSVLASVRFEDADLSNGTFERSELEFVSFDRAKLTNTLMSSRNCAAGDLALASDGKSASPCSPQPQADPGVKRASEPQILWGEAEDLFCREVTAVCPLMRRALGSSRTGFSVLPKLENVISGRIKAGGKCEAFNLALEQGPSRCLGQNLNDLIIQLR